MESTVLELPPHLPAAEGLRQLRANGETPPADLVLAFLPARDRLADDVAALAECWPAAARAGCETVTQFAGDRLATGGALHLFRFASPEGRAETELVVGSRELPPAPADLARLADHLPAGRSLLLLADGLRFPVQAALGEIRRRLASRGFAGPPSVAGGLASQEEPVARPGARVFAGSQSAASGLAAIVLSGVRVRIEVVRGWEPASPVHRVTRADGNVLWAIDDEPAADWFRRFFTVDGDLAPLPETSWRFPFIVEGPSADRRGVYRSLRFFDQPRGALTLWGDLEVGDEVRLGMGTEATLTHRAAELAATVAGDPPPEAAILYSCVGREAVLGPRAAEEVEAVSRALGCPALSGFFSFGEIGPTAESGPAFYNHTAILVLLHEDAAPGTPRARAAGTASGVRR